MRRQIGCAHRLAQPLHEVQELHCSLLSADCTLLTGALETLACMPWCFKTSILPPCARHNTENCRILVTVPACLEILLLSPTSQPWVRRIRYAILDEVSRAGTILCWCTGGISVLPHQAAIGALAAHCAACGQCSTPPATLASILGAIRVQVHCLNEVHLGEGGARDGAGQKRMMPKHAGTAPHSAAWV